MVVIGIDAHKRNHTALAVDELGRKLAQAETGTSSSDHLALLAWACRQAPEETVGGRRLPPSSRRLERDLLAAGEQIVRVPPKLMAHARDGARSYGKSDAIDALAVARAALREPQLPNARLDGPERELRLLVDHREDLVAERTRAINRLRWHLHDLDPTNEPPAGALKRLRTLARLARQLDGTEGTLARIARSLVARCRELTLEINDLQREITVLVNQQAPSLLAICGCGPLTAAKIVAETANITRFRSTDAYARHNGTAPLPVASGGVLRHRLSRSGNRQLNAALYRIALTQTRCHPPAKAMLARRKARGDSQREATRVLKRRLSDIVYRALLTDSKTNQTTTT